MKQQFGGVGSSLSGVALLAACCCGTSAGLARVNASYGGLASIRTIHPTFVAVGVVLIIVGLWRRLGRVPLLAMFGLALLMLGELLVPPMSITATHQFAPLQLVGLASSIVAAVLLVFAFYRAYPSRHPRFALTAMSGAAMATGCDCCLVAMGITGTLHALLPGQSWLPHTFTVYAVAATLIVIGLGKIGGALPAFVALAGQTWVYYWLELPYSKLPSIMLHGVNINFVIKYPMMLIGTLTVMSAFALAYRIQEARVLSRVTASVATGD